MTMKKEKGFIYEKIRSENLRVLQCLAWVKEGKGWERVGDVHCNFWGTHIYCWYRKPINND